MDEKDPRCILWENVFTLMIRDFGESNLGKVAKAANFAPANMTRVRAQKTDLSLKVLVPLAQAFKMPIWQLLTPDLGAHLHVVKGTQVSPIFDLNIVNTAKPLFTKDRDDGATKKRAGLFVINGAPDSTAESSFPAADKATEAARKRKHNKGKGKGKA